MKVKHGYGCGCPNCVEFHPHAFDDVGTCFARKERNVSEFSDEFSNELSDAELERLAILSEELGEAQQCIGKILRHGYESYNPLIDTGMTNRRELERELGDIALAIDLMCVAKDVNAMGISMRKEEKRKSIQRYLHHQPAKENPNG